MTRLEVTPAEAAILQEILESNLRELLHEIAHADHADFRERLRRRSAVVEALLSQMAVTERVA